MLPDWGNTNGKPLLISETHSEFPNSSHDERLNFASVDLVVPAPAPGTIRMRSGFPHLV